MSLAAAIGYAERCIAGGGTTWSVVVMAALACASTPFGTVLGIFTFVVLLRDL